MVDLHFAKMPLVVFLPQDCSEISLSCTGQPAVCQTILVRLSNAGHSQVACFSLPTNRGFLLFPSPPGPEISWSWWALSGLFPLQYPLYPSSNISLNLLLLNWTPPPRYHAAVHPFPLSMVPFTTLPFKSLEWDSGLRSVLALLDFHRPQVTTNQYVLATVFISHKCRFKTNSLVALSY